MIKEQYIITNEYLIKNNFSVINLPLNIYFYFFYFFKLYIYKKYIYKFSYVINYILGNSNYIYFIYNKYKIIYKLFYYFIYYFIFINRLEVMYNFIINKIIEKNYYIFNIIFITIKNIKKIWKYNKFFFVKKIKPILLYFHIFFRIPFSIYVAFNTYINKFKIYKYNEYLLNTFMYNYYPILKIILKLNLKKKFLIKTIYFFDNLGIKKKEIKNNIINLIKLNLYINKFNFIKFIILFEKEMYIFLYKFKKIYFLNILYIYIYNIWSLLHKEIDSLQMYKWNIFYLFHLYWWLYKYNLDLPILLYTLIILHIITIYIYNNNSNLINYKDIYNLLKKKYSLYNRKILKINFLIYSRNLFLKFFYYEFNNKWIKYKWIKYINFLIKNNTLIYVSTYINNITNKKFIYNIDIIQWKIQFSGIAIYKNNELINNININNYKYINNFLLLLKKKENITIKNYLYYLFIMNFYFKNLIINNINNFYLFIMNFYFKKIISNFFKIKIHYWLRKNNDNLNIKNFWDKNFLYYEIFYDKNLYLIIYIILIKKYIKII